MQLTDKRESEFALSEYREEPRLVSSDIAQATRPAWGVECDPKKGQSAAAVKNESQLNFFKQLIKQLSFGSLFSR